MSAGAWKNLLFFGGLMGAFIGLRMWLGRAAPIPDAFAQEVTLAQAIEQSSVSGKPVFALFTADWCPSCQQYKRGALSDGTVASALIERAIPVYVNVDHNPDDVALMAAMGLAVRSLPTSVVIRGHEIATSATGAQSGASVLAMIEAGEAH